VLKQSGVEQISGASYERIDERGLHLVVYGEPRLLEVDDVVVCAGQESVGELYDDLERADRLRGSSRSCHLMVAQMWPRSSTRNGPSPRACRWQPEPEMVLSDHSDGLLDDPSVPCQCPGQGSAFARLRGVMFETPNVGGVVGTLGGGQVLALGARHAGPDRCRRAPRQRSPSAARVIASDQLFCGGWRSPR
jgi:hypothetical protein